MKWWLLFLVGCAGVIQEPSTIDLFACPPNNCSQLMIEAIDLDWDTADCAFYDLDDEHIINSLSRLNYRLVLDEDAPKSLPAVRESGQGLMHNKFCILKNKTHQLLVTGTFNPTLSGQKNHNLLLISNSEMLSNHFLDEFEELFSGTFHGGSRSSILLNASGDLVFVSFCPEDDCEGLVLSLINSAQYEVLFMSFSITSKPIVKALINAHQRGVVVKGVVEPFQAGNTWAIPQLQKAGIKISKANTSGLFHHKHFIVDRKIIATGSYNPTKSGNERNDEALILIESKEKTKVLTDLFYFYS